MELEVLKIQFADKYIYEYRATGENYLNLHGDPHELLPLTVCGMRSFFFTDLKTLNFITWKIYLKMH